MGIITKRRILDYAKQHANAVANLNAWISVATASRLLRGERKFNTTHIRKTAEALNLEASLLI